MFQKGIKHAQKKTANNKRKYEVYKLIGCQQEIHTVIGAGRFGYPFTGSIYGIDLAVV